VGLVANRLQRRNVVGRGPTAILPAMTDHAATAGEGKARGLIVALDGPASSGKSSVGSAAAARLGYRFCDTGLLYRAVTWLAIHRRVAPDETDALVRLVDEIHLIDDGNGRLAHVAVHDVDQTAEVRGPDVDIAVSSFSGVAELRAALLQRQRQLVDGGRIIMAGRDIGTVVLPDADLKIYLDASVEERAARRALERGIEPDSPDGQEILAELRRRDELDSTRIVAPLRAAEDAVVIKTDGNTFEMTVSVVVNTIRRAEAERGIAEAPALAAPDAAPAAEPVPNPAVAEPARPAAPRPARAERRPMQPTPVATKLDPLVRLGSAVLRLIVRAIVRLRVEGDLAAIPREGALIVAANHASSADPVLIGAFLNSAINRPINWLGKRELLEWGLTGWAFRRAGIHPVDREAADLESFRTAMRILDAGQILAVFPEGTRSRNGALQRVREGVGMLALRSGALVLPVAVVDSDLMWPRGHLLPRFGKRVTVRYGTAFSVTDSLTGRGEPIKGREATQAATRLVMERIAALLPPRQRGVYATGSTKGASQSAATDRPAR
jgi:cytidylate kinase